MKKEKKLLISNDKLIIAKLREDGLDLSEEDINKFKEVIKTAKMTIWAGAMGMFEDNKCQKGTLEIATS